MPQLQQRGPRGYNGKMRPSLIIGAGPAGLAVGACLRQAGCDCLILEQSDRVGVAWHRHYNRLHLHTTKGQSALPGMSFPTADPRHPSRLQVIAYLEAYAAHFQLPIQFGEQVTAARQTSEGWQLETPRATYPAANVVVATGYNRTPNLPTWPGQSAYQGTLLHSAAYHTGEPFRDQHVLVVGFGNSGGEIAVDLHEAGARPSLAVRGPVNIVPREMMGIPIQTLVLAERWLRPQWADALNALVLRMAIGDLGRYGLQRPTQGPLTKLQQASRIPLIDIGTLELIRRGQIEVYPGIERFTTHGVIFTNGLAKDFDAVILATGYRPQVNTNLKISSDAMANFDPLLYDSAGTPLTSGTAVPNLPGLYFCGYHVAATGMLREIGREARRIAAAICATA